MFPTSNKEDYFHLNLKSCHNQIRTAGTFGSFHYKDASFIQTGPRICSHDQNNKQLAPVLNVCTLFADTQLQKKKKKKNLGVCSLPSGTGLSGEKTPGQRRLLITRVYTQVFLCFLSRIQIRLPEQLGFLSPGQGTCRADLAAIFVGKDWERLQQQTQRNKMKTVLSLVRG